MSLPDRRLATHRDIDALRSSFFVNLAVTVLSCLRDRSSVFFLWWPMLSMNMVEINVSKLLEFLQASNRQLLHLFSQS
jgi:hypothetical protein